EPANRAPGSCRAGVQRWHGPRRGGAVEPARKRESAVAGGDGRYVDQGRRLFAGAGGLDTALGSQDHAWRAAPRRRLPRLYFAATVQLAADELDRRAGRAAERRTPACSLLRRRRWDAGQPIGAASA